MPDQLVVLIGIIGIVLIGLAFTAIDLVKDAGRLIGLGLLVFLAVLMLNRSLPPTANNPSAESPTSPNYPTSPTYPTSPNYPTSPTSPTSPDQSRPAFTLDSAYRGLSDLGRRVLTGIDEFVYGNPYTVGQQPPAQSGDGQRLEPAPAEVIPPEQQGYQIRPDGVPSRVSTLVPSAGSSSSGSAGTVGPTRRPVSALW